MSRDIFGYALFTWQTGHRPISSFSEVFEHLVSSLTVQFDAIENESGSTRRQGLEIALSDTAILMTYSLIEGFFFEEYQFYLEKEPPRGQKLETTIQDLLTYMDVSVNERIGEGLTHLPGLRMARNAIAHRNGKLKEAEKTEIQKKFGSKVCIQRGYPVASISLIITIIKSASHLISSYSHAAVDFAILSQPSAQADDPTANGLTA